MVSSTQKGKESASPSIEAPEPTTQSNRAELVRGSSPQTKRAAVFTRLAIVGIVAAVVGIVWWMYSQGREETDDAYVEGHISNISSRVSGTVTRVFIKDNQLVKAGDRLLELDPNDYSVRVEQAEALLDEARHKARAAKDKINQSSLSSIGETTQATADVTAVQAQVESARFAILQTQSDIRRMETKIHEQEAQLRFAQSDFDRYKSAYAERVVTKQQFDKSKEACDVASAQLEQAQNSLQFEKDKEMQSKALLDEAVRRVNKSRGGVTTALAMSHQPEVDQEEFRSALGDVKKAEADLKQAKLNLSYTKVLAPVSGRIGHKSVEVGQRIDAGQLLLAIVQPDCWITANFKETQIGKMRQGQHVEIEIDSFPGRKFSGRLDSLAPASGAEFSMLPPDNATGNFTKVVQRVPAKILFDQSGAGDTANKVAPGMSAVVTVFTKE